MMITQKQEEIKIQPDFLKSLIQKIIQSDLLELDSWECSPLGKNKDESSVFRVNCTFTESDNRRDYTFILKILKPDSKRNQADHYYYWKREALVYSSGILNQLPNSIRAPKCYAVEEHVDGNMWIWLEDIAIDYFQRDWSFQHLKKITYLLGKYNASYLNGTPLPTEAFYCRTWMRSWIDVCTAYAKPVEEQKVIWDLHLFDFKDKSATWECYHNNRTRISRLLETLKLLPRVFAHQDVHWDNIFVEQNGGWDSLIAIDWQFASISGVGEELGRMFGYALLNRQSYWDYWL